MRILVTGASTPLGVALLDALVVDPAVEPRPDPFEVADIFEVPLDFLADETNHQRHSREFQGKLRHFYAMLWDERRIWGATAGMLVNLAEVLREAR